MKKTHSRRKKKGRQRCTKVCTALHQSEVDKWFFFLLLFFFFYLHDLVRNLKSLWSWRWIYRCLCSSTSPGFAESSWQMDHEETSPSQITCNGQLQITHFITFYVFIYSSLPLSLFLLWAHFEHFCFFLTPSFVFILTFKRNTLPSPQFRLLSYILSQMREGGMGTAPERAVPSVFGIIMSFLSFLQSTRKVTNELHSETANVLLTLRAKGRVLWDTFHID